MAAVDFVAPFLYELYDMESEFRLHDFGYGFGVGKVERHVGELRHKFSSSEESQFSSSLRAL